MSTFETRPTVYATGVKNRCRKVDRHSFKLDDAAFPLPYEEQVAIEKAALATVRRQMLHVVGRVLLVLNKVEIDDGFVKFQMFGPDNRTIDLTDRFQASQERIEAKLTEVV